jgi:hypothetical protein
LFPQAAATPLLAGSNLDLPAAVPVSMRGKLE